MKTTNFIFLLLLTLSMFYSCSKDKDPVTPTPVSPPPTGASTPTLYTLNIPAIFAQTLPAPYIPSDNPLTVEGVELGRHLFYDPILSGDGTQSCASCHSPSSAFTDTSQFSTGIDGLKGDRNSMAIFNAAWNFDNRFFWDGRAIGLEGQAFQPVTNPIEMHNTWTNAIASLQIHPNYPNMFNAAFGTSTIDSVLAAKAIAQFERTLISANSKFDRYLLGMEALTPQEASGFNLFMDQQGGDCFHCHGSAGNPLWTDNEYHNNGLDATFTDLGLGAVTGNSTDNGKFKTPSLRNLVFTAPYMHDGRFQTLDEVLEHYSTGVVMSPTIDPMMEHAANGGVQLTTQEKANLKAFLLSLTDNSFVTNPAYQAP